MALLYDRRIRVEVAGLIVEDLRITFEIEREVDATQNKGTVTIFNLAPENEERIYKRADEIVVQAGYPETVAILHRGFVQSIERVREQLSRRTVIKLGDAVRRAGKVNPRLGGAYSTTLNGTVPIRDIVGGIANAMDMPLGPLDLIPEFAAWTNWAFSGPAWVAMSAALRRVKCTWYDDHGVIRIHRRGSIRHDAPRITVSPENGLLDRPIVTDEGAKAVMLLNPAVVLGCQIDIESDSLSGSWQVVALKHAGDNWRSGQFRTTVELREVGVGEVAGRAGCALRRGAVIAGIAVPGLEQAVRRPARRLHPPRLRRRAGA